MHYSYLNNKWNINLIKTIIIINITTIITITIIIKIKKDTVAHVGLYRISGNSAYDSLIPFALTEETIANSVAIISLSWENPSNFLKSLEQWLNILEIEIKKSISSELLEELKGKSNWIKLFYIYKYINIYIYFIYLFNFYFIYLFIYLFIIFLCFIITNIINKYNNIFFLLYIKYYLKY